jgi:O-methyltransferase
MNLRQILGQSLSNYYARKGRVIATYAKLNNTEDAIGLNLIQKIKEETQMLLKDQEAFLIYKMVRKAEKILGEIAEVGVYKGGSAKLIREASEKPLHLFDTFEGLPGTSVKDNQQKFKKGELSASLEDVKEYLQKYKDVYFYKGLFPATASPIENKRFSLVHLDVDLYESTFECLRFFYPCMSPGGIILSHDYQSLIGVKRAFDEFFEHKPEIIIEPVGTSQALVIKV